MWEQIREILQADRTIGTQGVGEDDEKSSSRSGEDAGTVLQSSDRQTRDAATLPDQATALRRSSSDSWRSAGSQLDVDTDSEGSLGKEGLSNDISNDASLASPSGSMLAQTAEPKEVEVVKQEGSYRPIMWCALAA